jgi:23S rRNA (uridine2552-2'-O)-methyltransferase
VGVEIKPLEPPAESVVVLQLDFTEPEAPRKVAEALGRPAAAVCCDAAPKLTGIRDIDRAGLEEIYHGALRVIEAVLMPRGALILKGFPGPESDRFRSVLRELFPKVSEVRPEGKRHSSREFYWVAGGEPGSRQGAGRRRRRGRRS